METQVMDRKKTRAESSDFREFFIEELKDIYWAEKQLHKTLPKLTKATTSDELRNAFEQLMQETEKHIQEVENIFGLLGEKPQTKKCEAMEGLLKEAQEVIGDTEKNSYTRDAALIMAAQKAGHYEIAAYGTLRIFAGHMGEKKVKKNLESILEDEKKTDMNLTKIAEGHINMLASEE